MNILYNKASKSTSEMNFGNPVNFAKYQLQQKLKSSFKYQLYYGSNKSDKTNVLVYVLSNINRSILERLMKFESTLVYPYSDIYLIENTAYVVYTLQKNETFLLEYIADNQVSEELLWDWLEYLALYYNELSERRLAYYCLDMSLFSIVWLDNPDESSAAETSQASYTPQTPYAQYNISAQLIASLAAQGAPATPVPTTKTKCRLVYYGVCTLFNEYYGMDKTVELNAQCDVLIIGKFISGCVSKYVLSYLKQQTTLAPQDYYYQSILPVAVCCTGGSGVSRAQSEFYSYILLYLLSYTQLDAAERLPLAALLSHPMLSTSRDEFNILSYNTFEEKDFDIIRKIGEGGFGVVQLARHRFSNYLVVLKSSARVGIQRKEANLLRNLSHPNVVRLYGDFADRNIYYIAIQYCESGDLLHYLQRNRKVPKELQLPWIAYICSALFYMHGQSLMHRDIKPENILISNNQLFITDFGISKEISSETNTIIGTPMYFAPEVYKHAGYSFPADVYSLGLVIYNMLTGEHIYRNTPRDQAEFFNSRNYQRQIEDKMVFVSRPFRTLVFGMLRYTPAERPTMAQICENVLIYQYLVQTGLPGAQQNAILMSPRAKRPNIDLTALFARYGGGVEAMCERLTARNAVLDNAFTAVAIASGYFLRSSLGLPKTSFGAYLSQFMGVEVQEILKQRGALQDVKRIPVRDAELEVDADIYFYVGPVAKIVPRSKPQFVFAVTWDVEESIDLERDVCIVVNNINFNRSVYIKLAPTTTLAVYKIETSKHYKISGQGTVYTDVCALIPSQKPFDAVFGHSEQLYLLGEFANSCFPMLFKDGRGYWRNEGAWDQK